MIFIINDRIYVYLDLDLFILFLFYMDTNFSCYILEYGVNIRNLYSFLGILVCFPKRFNEYFRQAVIAD